MSKNNRLDSLQSAIADSMQTQDTPPAVNAVPKENSVVFTQPADPQEAARLAKAKRLTEARQDAARSYGTLHESTKLAFYATVGRKSRAAILLAKQDMDEDAFERKVVSGWKEADVDSQINALTVEIEALFPHIFFRASEEEGKKKTKATRSIESHLADYVWVSVACDLCQDIIGEKITDVSYHVMINFVVRRLLVKSKIDLSGRIKDGWTEFVRIHLDKLALGTISPSEFVGEMESWEKKLADDRKAASNAGLTPAEIKAREDAAKETAKNAAKSARTAKLNNALTEALTAALAKDGLDHRFVGAMIAALAKEAKVSLSELGFESNNAIDPRTVTSAELLDIIRSIGVSGRMNVMSEVVIACAAMAPLFSTPSPKPSLGLVGT